jgi:malonyl CoA-acyl carrier protein transacylase
MLDDSIVNAELAKRAATIAGQAAQIEALQETTKQIGRYAEKLDSAVKDHESPFKRVATQALIDGIKSEVSRVALSNTGKK